MATYCYTLYDPYRRSPYSYVSMPKRQRTSPKYGNKQPAASETVGIEFDPSEFFEIPDLLDYQDNNQYRTMDVFQHQQPIVYSSTPMSFPIHQQLLPQPMYPQMMPIRPKSQPRTMFNVQTIMYNRHFTKRRRVDSKRSITGCYTCRLRRVKCDETKPMCKGCFGINIACEYPSHENQRSTYTIDPAARQQLMEEIKKKRAAQRT